VKYTLDLTTEQSKAGMKQGQRHGKKNFIVFQHSLSMPATVPGSSPAPDMSATVPKKQIQEVG
jgi:hypothetical protein